MSFWLKRLKIKQNLKAKILFVLPQKLPTYYMLIIPTRLRFIRESLPFPVLTNFKKKKKRKKETKQKQNQKSKQIKNK